MEYYCEHKWGNTSDRLSITCIVLFNWNCKNLLIICRSKKARTSTEIIYKIYSNKDSSNLWVRLALFKITQGIVQAIMQSTGIGGASQSVLPTEMIQAIEKLRFF